MPSSLQDKASTAEGDNFWKVKVATWEQGKHACSGTYRGKNPEAYSENRRSKFLSNYQLRPTTQSKNGSILQLWQAVRQFNAHMNMIEYACEEVRAQLRVSLSSLNFFATSKFALARLRAKVGQRYNSTCDPTLALYPFFNTCWMPLSRKTMENPHQCCQFDSIENRLCSVFDKIAFRLDGSPLRIIHALHHQAQTHPTAQFPTQCTFLWHFSPCRVTTQQPPSPTSTATGVVGASSCAQLQRWKPAKAMDVVITWWYFNIFYVFLTYLLRICYVFGCGIMQNWQ